MLQKEEAEDPPYPIASNGFTVCCTLRNNKVDLKEICEISLQAAQLLHAQLRLALLCVTEHRFLLSLQYPHCIPLELSSFLHKAHLIAVASVSH